MAEEKRDGDTEKEEKRGGQEALLVVATAEDVISSTRSVQTPEN